MESCIDHSIPSGGIAIRQEQGRLVFENQDSASHLTQSTPAHFQYTCWRLPYLGTPASHRLSVCLLRTSRTFQHCSRTSESGSLILRLPFFLLRLPLLSFSSRLLLLLLLLPLLLLLLSRPPPTPPRPPPPRPPPPFLSLLSPYCLPRDPHFLV